MRQVLLDLTVVRKVTFEHCQQVAQIDLGTEVVDQARVGFHPLLLAGQRRVVAEQAWGEGDGVVGVDEHGGHVVVIEFVVSLFHTFTTMPKIGHKYKRQPRARTALLRLVATIDLASRAPPVTMS